MRYSDPEQIGRFWRGHLSPVPDASVNLVQISDIHWKIDVPKQDREDSLREHLRQYRDNAGVSRIDGVLVTGDVLDGPSHSAGADATGQRRNFEMGHRQSAAVMSRCFRDEYGIENPAASVLAVPGNHDVLRSAQTMKGEPPYSYESFARHFSPAFLPDCEPGSPLCPRYCLFGNQMGVVAVFGLDSNLSVYQYGADGEWAEHGLVHTTQLRALTGAIRKLRDAVRDRPLYLIVCLHHHLLPVWAFQRDEPVSCQKDLRRVTVDTRNIIDELQAARVSLVLHGHMHQHAVQQVSYISTEVRVDRAPLHVVGCGRHELEHRATVVSIDLRRGAAAVTLVGSRPVEGSSVTLPLVSASRVSSQESRLYQEVRAWLDRRALPSGRPLEDLDPPVPELVAPFRAMLEAEWERSGHVQVCSGRLGDAEVSFPVPVETATEVKRYYLLLLLDNARTILVNNHRSLRASEYSFWDTFLLPAFRNLRELVEHARLDQARALERFQLDSAGNVARRSVAERTAEELLSTGTEEDWKAMESRLRFLDRASFTKFSPINGRPQCYEYTLVSFDGFADPDGRMSRLFESAPRIDPGQFNDMNDGADFARRFAPGYCWLPCDAWRKLWSMQARNSDVMRWVESYLTRIKGQEGQLPGWLMPGGLAGKPVLKVEVVDWRPFDGNAGRDPEGFPNDLVTGLRETCFGSGDLKGNPAYTGCAFEQVRLKACEVKGRRRILVFDLRGRKRGVLRPTQRYVLRQGLERAGQLAEAIRSYAARFHAGSDPHDLEGYRILRLPGGMRIALLPPILETIPASEWEQPPLARSKREEFLVCDGNHRIVEHCWNSGLTLRAVLVRNPPQPFYAHPFSANEWHFTAGNVTNVPPDTYSKYAPRRYREDNPLSYRSLYRDFSTGFLNVGGQGGR